MNKLSDTVVVPNNGSTDFPLSPVTFHPSAFPAWVPAVTVASGMIIFLAASFYLRHRKVMKKRELLMDYFYIIFQYGGMRRKRMVAALCNTNAISLRDLGKSFMISFDSASNPENSCPFFLEDSAFNGSNNTSPSGLAAAQKKTFFKRSRATTRGLFRRLNTQSMEHGPPSFQDILMKFKSKRNAAANPVSPNMSSMRRQTGQYQGSSMCAIHGDDYDYHTLPPSFDASCPPRRFTERRNAYVPHLESTSSRFADVVTEVGRLSLGDVDPHLLKAQMSYASASSKRNSDPWDSCHHSLTPSNTRRHSVSQGSVILGSQQYIPHIRDLNPQLSTCSSNSFRNSEPTILIQGASTDIDAENPQVWNDIRSKYINGIVFLKRVPKGNGEYYYEEQNMTPQDRSNLNKVSSVRSGNMSEYYNCLHSPKRQSVEKKSSSGDDKVSPESVCQTPESWRKTNDDSSTTGTPVVSRSRRPRMSLGEIAVSGLNKRIVDFPTTESSSQDQDPESGIEPCQPKSQSAWNRFKNVFSGSRASSQSTESRGKVSKSSTEDRPKRRNRRSSRRWGRFFHVFTGFRSLPDGKEGVSRSMDEAHACSSLPLSMESQGSTQDSFDVVEHESGEFRYVPRSPKSILKNSNDPMSFKAYDSNKGKHSRPRTLRVPIKTHSFPEELAHGNYHAQSIQDVVTASMALQRRERPSGAEDPKSPPEKSKLHNESVTDPLKFLHTVKGDSPTNAFNSPMASFRLREPKPSLPPSPLSVPNKLETEVHIETPSRRFRTLSPLPERSDCNSMSSFGGSKSLCGWSSEESTAAPSRRSSYGNTLTVTQHSDQDAKNLEPKASEQREINGNNWENPVNVFCVLDTRAENRSSNLIDFSNHHVTKTMGQTGNYVYKSSPDFFCFDSKIDKKEPLQPLSADCKRVFASVDCLHQANLFSGKPPSYSLVSTVTSSVTHLREPPRASIAVSMSQANVKTPPKFCSGLSVHARPPQTPSRSINLATPIQSYFTPTTHTANSNFSSEPSSVISPESSCVPPQISASQKDFILNCNGNIQTIDLSKFTPQTTTLSPGPVTVQPIDTPLILNQASTLQQSQLSKIINISSNNPLHHELTSSPSHNTPKSQPKVVSSMNIATAPPASSANVPTDPLARLHRNPQTIGSFSPRPPALSRHDSLPASYLNKSSLGHIKRSPAFADPSTNLSGSCPIPNELDTLEDCSDEPGMMNLTRLPRFPRRASLGAAVTMSPAHQRLLMKEGFGKREMSSVDDEQAGDTDALLRGHTDD